MRLIDASKDSGLTIPPRGQQMLAQFKLVDPSDAENKAYGLAMKDARKQAALLADLAELKLGPIRSVTVTATSSSSGKPKTPVVYNPYIRTVNSHSASDKLTSIEMKPIAVEVTLEVQFTTSEKGES